MKSIAKADPGPETAPLSQEKGNNSPQFRDTERAWPDSWAKEYFVAPAFSLLNETNGIFKVKISSWEIIDGKDSSPFHLPHPIKTFLSLCMMFGERQITLLARGHILSESLLNFLSLLNVGLDSGSD